MRRPLPIVLLAISAGLSGCGDDAGSGGEGAGRDARQVDIVAIEYAFTSEERITIVAGDVIRFNVRNDGQLDHQLEVLTDANKRLGITERIKPGGTSDVTVTFEEPGVYRVICDIDDHQSRGQVAQFTVK